MKHLLTILATFFLLTACNQNSVSQQSDIDNQIKCIEFGNKNFLEEDPRNIYLEQKFSYSSELDTCLYYYHWVAGEQEDRGIRDMFADKITVFHMRSGETETCMAFVMEEMEKVEMECEDVYDFMDIYDKYFR